MQKLFGRTYDDTVGSIEKDLILKTRGEVKIQVGKKFVDLIKNGKVVRDSSNYLFKEIDSLDEMSSDGIYVYDGYVYIKIKDRIIRVCTYDEDLFVSYLDLQDTTYDQKETARRNIGLEFNNLVEALNSVKKGFVFVNDKIYYIDNGRAIEFNQGGLNVNYSINYSGGGSYNPYNSGSSSGDSSGGDDSGGDNPSNIPEYNEMKILELNENIMVTTIMFVVENTSQLSSIKNNGVFLKIIDKQGNRLNFIPEGEYNKPITELDENIVNIKYTDLYKDLMHVDMHVRFHYFDYIKKEDFQTCILALDKNLNNVLKYYVLYTYGYESLTASSYDDNGNPIPGSSNSPAKQGINISFPMSFVEVNGIQGQRTNYTCQDYIVSPNNIILDSEKFSWYLDNNNSPLRTNVIELDDRSVGTHLIKVKFIGDNKYNSTEASYTLNYTINDNRQQAEFDFDLTEVTIETNSPQLVQNLDLPEGINKSDINWKIITKEGKEVTLTPDISGNVVIPYQNSEEVTVYAQFNGNSLYKAKTIQYKVKYNVEPPKFSVDVIGSDSSWGTSEDYRVGGSISKSGQSYNIAENGSFVIGLRYIGDNKEQTTYNRLGTTLDNRGIPTSNIFEVDNWGICLFNNGQWDTQDTGEKHVVNITNSPANYGLSLSTYTYDFKVSQPYTLYGDFTCKVIRIPASGTTDYNKLLILRNYGHFLPRFGETESEQIEGGAYENYLDRQWDEETHHHVTSLGQDWGEWTPQNKWKYRWNQPDMSKKQYDQLITHTNQIKEVYAYMDTETLYRSHRPIWVGNNKPFYQVQDYSLTGYYDNMEIIENAGYSEENPYNWDNESLNDQLNYNNKKAVGWTLPEDVDFKLVNGIDINETFSYHPNGYPELPKYTSNDRLLQYKFGPNYKMKYYSGKQDEGNWSEYYREYAIQLYGTLVVHFIQETRTDYRVYYGSIMQSRGFVDSVYAKDYGYIDRDENFIQNIFLLGNSKIIEGNSLVVPETLDDGNFYVAIIANKVDFINSDQFSLYGTYMWGDQNYTIYQSNYHAYIPLRRRLEFRKKN